MTVAVAVKFFDGVVLASDSAGTLSSEHGVANIYEHSNKIFNLHKNLPIGVMTWDTAAFGNKSVSHSIKDFRVDLHEELSENDDYELSDIAEDLSENLQELYDDMLESYDEDEDAPSFGMNVSGYSKREGYISDRPESYTYKFHPDGDNEYLEDDSDASIQAFAAQGAIKRLLTGISQEATDFLASQLEGDPQKLHQLFQNANQVSTINLVQPNMPLQDAIDLAEFLVDMTKKFFRFKVGPPIVAGPTEIATITKHEHFKWVQRKHYFSRELNPEEERFQ